MSIFRKYPISETISFRNTKGVYGGLSNMSSGYPITYKGLEFRTSEHLYQSFKFVDKNIIEKIRLTPSPIGAKKIAYEYADFMLDNWDGIRYNVMYECLRLKLEHNKDTFGGVLKSTKGKYIVEYVNDISDVWGCIKEDNYYIGVNALGRLLMKLRDEHERTYKDDRSDYGLAPNIICKAGEEALIEDSDKYDGELLF